MSGKILVIDDVWQNQLLLEAQLSAAGYDIVLASSGQEGLDVLRADPDLELVLLDIMMPQMDGFETCRRMRELPGGRDIPIVFVTASHETALHQQALDSGADDFLRKPVERTELLLRVRSLVRIRRLLRQQALLTNLLVHDMKNPLAGILTNAAFARDGTEDVTTRGALDDVMSAGEHLQRMVMNLLDIGRAEDGALGLRLEEVPVSTLLAPLVAHNRRRLELRRQSIELAVGQEVVRVDADLASRLFQNLIDNAMRYAPRGTAIVVDHEKVDGALRLRVRDEGPGVPAEARTRIFEKYGQAAGGNERSSRGLGLLFCRLVAEAHGGRIWVEDNQPRGTMFVLELPKRGT